MPRIQGLQSGDYWTQLSAGVFNVRWCGAVGDGVTDDTAAIAAALVEAEARKVPVYFPSSDGAYLTSETITIDWDGGWLVGDPGIGSIIKFTGTGTCVFFDGGSNAGGGLTQGLSWCGVRDLRIEGTATATTGLRLRGVNHSEFKNLRIVNVSEYGVLAESCWASLFESIKISTFDNDVDDLPHYGMYFTRTVGGPSEQQCETCTIVSPVIEGIVSAGSGTAILFDYAENCQVYGGLLESCEVAVWCTSNATLIGTHDTWCNSTAVDIYCHGTRCRFENHQTFALVNFTSTARACVYAGGHCNGNITVDAGAKATRFELASLTGTFTDNGTDTYGDRWNPGTETRTVIA